MYFLKTGQDKTTPPSLSRITEEAANQFAVNADALPTGSTLTKLNEFKHIIEARQATVQLATEAGHSAEDISKTLNYKLSSVAKRFREATIKFNDADLELEFNDNYTWLWYKSCVKSAAKTLGMDEEKIGYESVTNKRNQSIEPG